MQMEAGPHPEQLAAVVFDDAVLALALLSPEGRVLRCNRAWGELFGPDLAGTIGAPMVQHALRSPGEATAIEQPFLRGGATYWCRQVCKRVERAGEPPCYLVQALDITEQKSARYQLEESAERLRVHLLEQDTERRRAAKEIVLLNNLLEERIRKRTGELQERNDDLRDFAYSLAHDLRAPLASIDGFSARLEQGLSTQLDENHRHYLQRIRAGVKVMADFTDALLALADLAHAELRRQPVDLSALARLITGRLREQQPGRDVSVEVHDTPAAEGDPRLLAAVMENLIGNAWKFTSRTASARILFGSETSANGECLYHVKDTGAGFDPAYAHKLFGPFQRLHTASEFAGTGIGLAMVRKIVSRHGGHIWAESLPGAGASFYFTLNEEIRVPPRPGVVAVATGTGCGGQGAEVAPTASEPHAPTYRVGE